MIRKLKYVELREAPVLRKVGDLGINWNPPPERDRSLSFVLTDEKFDLEQSGNRLLIRPREEAFPGADGIVYTKPMDLVLTDLAYPEAARGKERSHAGAASPVAVEEGGSGKRRPDLQR